MSLQFNEQHAKVAAKVRKLFALAEKNGNPHEAARALDKARALLRAHGLEASSVRAEAEDDSPSGRIKTQVRKPSGSRLAEWQKNLAHAACQLCEAAWFYRPGVGEISFYGAPMDVQAAAVTFDALCAVLKSALRESKKTDEYKRSSNRGAFTRSFRVGFTRKAVWMAQDAIKAEQEQTGEQADTWALVVATKREDREAYADSIGLRSGSRPRSRRQVNSAGMFAGAQAAASSGAVRRVSGQIQ